ncbi:CHAP domain-containing protein [Nonomuraea sp. NPDC049646]|uniref:CHAP domain-containing protein n=1 Tax=unclassified Nonomuraea TaxID=2593643 RepID=UPI0037983172
MTPEMQKYIDLLESQLGYAEKAGAYTKFGDWYGKTVEFDADYSAAPWCDMYLSWAAHKLGYQEWIGQFAWTVRHAEWFKAQGAWGKTPKPGAFVFYDWSGSGKIDNIDHVGIVTRVEGDTIFTIEGNIDGGVAKRKERDTSKVVGYGYPERVKARLDEEAAQKRADEQAATPARPGTDVGTLQLPADSLASLIPHVEQERAAEAPLAARPKTKTGEPARTTASSPPAPAAAPSASASPATGAAPAPTAAAGRSGQKSKHAKATTADTTSATAEPLPTLVDASSTGSIPAIGSPSLVGSALIAALALVALAKTRQSRLRPAAAAKAARVRAAALSADEGVTLSIAALNVTSPESTSVGASVGVAAGAAAGVSAGVTAGVSAGVTAGIAVPVALPVPVPVAVPLPGARPRRGTHAAPSRHRRRRRPAETRHEHTRPSSPRTGAEPTTPFERAAAPSGTGFERAAASSGTGFERAAVSPDTGRRHRFELAAGSPETGREDAVEFAAASPEAGQEGRFELGAGSFEGGRSRTFEFAAPVPEPGPAGGAELAAGADAFEAFEAFTDRAAPPRRLDSASFRPAPDTAPFEPMFDTGPMVPISLPPATSTFSAFSPSPRPGAEVAARTRTTPRAAQASGIGATYQGRRRRSEPVPDAYASDHPFFMDEFTADSVPRGRRHRRAGTAGTAGIAAPAMSAGVAVSQHPQGRASTIDAFVQDAPLRGRRHRAPTREIVSTPDWGRQPA